MAGVPKQDESVLIVGSGVFGLSLAYELVARRKYSNVTVVDRFLPPVVDSSSVDISRIIRSDYADPLYEALGREAVAAWRDPEYSAHYHESGFAMITNQPENLYMTGVRKAQKAQGGRDTVQLFDHHHADGELKARYPGLEANFRGYMATLNPEGGWADAAGSIRSLAERAAIAGVSFVTGKRGTVTRLEFDAHKRVLGVHVASGTFIPAVHVVLATGAWTDAVVDGVDHAVLASAQPVGFIQLTPAEAERLRKMPVITNMDTGVFCFPPTPDSHIMKVARHGYGYTTRYTTEQHGNRMVSSPKRDGNNATSQFLPEEAEKALREGVRHFFPSISDRPWMKKRLCWYQNTPAGDFIVDRHPEYPGLFVATGGSGHGFKFLPVLGKYIADCFEGTASESLREKWCLRPHSGKAMDMPGDGSRAGPPLRALRREEQAKL
ncbi:sarcosine oxidase [Thozetella sp. PMI_491]|nr:sarcosine oxidase [Thozetella sp. PMI_491]